MKNSRMLLVCIGLSVIILPLIFITCSSNSTTSPALVPTVPSQLNGSAITSSSAILYWQDNSDNENGFDLFRHPVENQFWTRVVRLPANTDSYIDTALTDSSAYTYYVRAFNTAGNSTASATFTLTTFAIGLPPDAPRNQIPWNGVDSVLINQLFSWECVRSRRRPPDFRYKTWTGYDSRYYPHQLALRHAQPPAQPASQPQYHLLLASDCQGYAQASDTQPAMVFHDRRSLK